MSDPREVVDGRARVARRPNFSWVVRTGKVELGQGIQTALAQIAADELGCPVSMVEVAAVDTDLSPDEGVTSGSLSVQQAGEALRQACRALGLTPRAADAPGEVGSSAQRPDLWGVFRGHGGHYIQDPVLPLAPAAGMPGPALHGRVLHPPRLGACLLAFDDGLVWRQPGVRLVQRSGQLLGLVALTSAQADAALAVMAEAAQWQVEPDPPEDARDLQALPATTRTVVDGGTAPAAVRTLKARYSKPWIAHASIAPSCARAWMLDGRLHVFSHSQGVFNLRRDLALAFGLAETEVRVVHQPSAGCYGHNGADDVAFDAAWLARALPGTEIRVRWRREDELTHAPFGPAMVVALQAGLDAQGGIASWQHELWSPGHSRRPGRSATPALLGAWQVENAAAVPPSIDMPLAVGGGAERNAVPGYDFAAVRVLCHSVSTRRRSSALRALGAFANVFAAESFMDEIAHATGTDPLALRRRHLQHDPRALAVLDAVAERAGWSQRGHRARDEGAGLGLAVARYKGTGAWCAVAAEVLAGATLQVRRLTIAVDVGLAINPDGVCQQIEGGAIQATSWTLKEAAQTSHQSWADYPILRFSEVPQVDVLLLPSTAPSLGAGEASMGPTAAAIANALFDALGVRVRDLPLTPETIVAAMSAADAERAT